MIDYTRPCERPGCPGRIAAGKLFNACTPACSWFVKASSIVLKIGGQVDPSDPVAAEILAQVEALEAISRGLNEFYTARDRAVALRPGGYVAPQARRVVRRVRAT